jgi:hypothetical protein
VGRDWGGGGGRMGRGRSATYRSSMKCLLFGLDISLSFLWWGFWSWFHCFLRQGLTCSPDWPGTWDSPASVSQVLRLQACAITSTCLYRDICSWFVYTRNDKLET